MPPWSSPIPMHIQSKALSFAACHVSIPHIEVIIILIFVRQVNTPPPPQTDQGIYSTKLISGTKGCQNGTSCIA